MTGVQTCALPISSSDTASQRMRPAITPEARQKQMISLATDCAEDLMRSGKAPSQIIVHYLKLGTKQAELELEKTKKELALTEAKTKSIQSSEQAEELYKNALDAFRGYSGRDSQRESDEYEWDD